MDSLEVSHIFGKMYVVCPYFKFFAHAFLKSSIQPLFVWRISQDISNYLHLSPLYELSVVLTWYYNRSSVQNSHLVSTVASVKTADT